MQKIDKEKIKTWFVTGASSGVGYELCKQLLDRGYNVIAVSRRVPDFESSNALCLSVDVTKPETIQAAIDKGIEKFGRIDVLSNNAGISANITVEEEHLEHLKQVFETNYFGTFNVINAILPHFRANKNGTIINNTSQSGISCRAYGCAYVSSKHAIEGLTSVLWHETKSFCRVMALELGYFKGTEIYKNSLSKKSNISDYKTLNSFYIKFKRNFENNLSIAIDCLINQIEENRIPRRLMLGKDAMIQIGAEIKELKKDYNASYWRAIKCAEKIKKSKSNFINKIFRGSKK